MSKSADKASKFLSLILRHKPETIGLTLDEAGWADTDELLKKLTSKGFELTIEQLKSLVEANDKKRFAFSHDFSKIRANQGHSLQVELGLKLQMPPEKLYHGTAEKNIASIKSKGLIKGERHHVHLTDNPETAIAVGSRYGKPVALIIEAAKMHAAGMQFFISENRVWLADHVPAEFIEFPR